MAIYHLHIQALGRSKNRSSIAAAAYRSASKITEKILNQETGEVREVVHDYRSKKGVVFSAILAPDNAPAWMKNREQLWNRIQNEFDDKPRSVFCSEIDLALPAELTEEQNKELLSSFARNILVKEGMVVDMNIHMDNPENPHAHLMLSTREIVEGSDGKYTFGLKVREWNRTRFLVYVRGMWAAEINKHLRMAGINQEVSHLSYRERGIAMLPSAKEGVGRYMKNDGRYSERSERNEEIAKVNAVKICANPKLIIDLLRTNRAVFTREQVSAELLKFLGDNSQHLDAYKEALEAVMSSDKLVELGERDLEGRKLYTSLERHALEKDFVRVAHELRDKEMVHNLGLSVRDLEAKSGFEQAKDKLKSGKKIVLSPGQKDVVLGIVNGGNVSVIEGLPGAGKTSTMQEAVRQYKKAGYRVIGTAVSSSAARELGNTAGIEAMNITKLRQECDLIAGREWKLNLKIDYFNEVSKTGSKGFLNKKTVLIVDESSMVDLTEMHYIISEVKGSGAKLVVLGDTNQLSSVGIKGAAEKMSEIFGVLRLKEVVRQKLDSHRQAAEFLGEYKVEKAIEIYKNTGVLSFEKDTSLAMVKLVDDYLKKHMEMSNKGNLRGVVALSYTNEDTANLNNEIRSKLKDMGEIYGKEVAFEVDRGGVLSEIAIAIGDKVVFTRNSSYLNVHNSDIGEVIGFGKSCDRKTVKVRLEHDKNFLGVNLPSVIEVDNLYYKDLDYGYAVNIYKAQGKTYENVFGLITNQIGYHSFNVLATRHKNELKLYAGDDVLKRELYGKITNQDGITYEIKGDFRYGGLTSIAGRRDERSFSTDYKQFRNSKEGNILSDYIEARDEVVKTWKLIDDWAQKYHADFKESPYYEDLRVLISSRKSIAGHICDNYEQFGKSLTQAGVNFSALERHAGRSEHKYYFSREDSHGELPNLGEFIESYEALSDSPVGPLFREQNKRLIQRLYDASSELMHSFSESRFDLESAKLELENMSHEKNNMLSYICNGKNYVAFGFKNFIEKTYRGGPEEIISKCEAMIEEKGIERSVTLLAKSPELLGKLSGIGIGSIFSITSARDRALANLKELPSKLSLYEEYKARIPEVENSLKEINIEAKEKEVKSFEAKLPENSIEEFVMETNKASTSEEIMSFIHDPQNLAKIKVYKNISLGFTIYEAHMLERLEKNLKSDMREDSVSDYFRYEIDKAKIVKLCTVVKDKQLVDDPEINHSYVIKKAKELYTAREGLIQKELEGNIELKNSPKEVAYLVAGHIVDHNMTSTSKITSENITKYKHLAEMQCCLMNEVRNNIKGPEKDITAAAEFAAHHFFNSAMKLDNVQKLYNRSVSEITKLYKHQQHQCAQETLAHNMQLEAGRYMHSNNLNL